MARLTKEQKEAKKKAWDEKQKLKKQSESKIEEAEVIETKINKPEKKESKAKGYVDPLMQESVDEKEYAMGVNSGASIGGELPEQEIPKNQGAFDFSILEDPVNQQEEVEEKPQPTKPRPQKQADETQYEESEPKEEKTAPLRNPAFDDMSPKEQGKSAERMADAIISAYEWLHEAGKKYFTLSEDKLKKLASRGKINIEILDVQIPMSMDDPTKLTSIGEFLDDYNETINESLIVTDEFKEKVKPALIRILEKRGAGLSDEQFLMLTVGEDLFTKASSLIQSKMYLKELLNVAQGLLDANRPQPKRKPRPQPQAQQPQAEATTEAQPEPTKEEVTAEKVNEIKKDIEEVEQITEE